MPGLSAVAHADKKDGSFFHGFIKTEFNSTPIFTMKFRQFPKGDLDTTENIQQQAKEIDRLAACEWWKD